MAHGKITLVSVAALLAACGSPSPSTETLRTDTTSWCFSGGPIYTASDAQPIANYLAVKNGTISYVSDKAGEEDWCAAHGGADAQQVNLSGKALYPGFTDAHAHLLGIGLRELTLNLEGTDSVSELLTRLEETVTQTPEGVTVYGRGWIETHWPEKRFPNRQDLDAVSPNHPVILERADGHAVVVNSAAINAAKITADTEAPFGGDILKDDAGEPTGMLIDNAGKLVEGLMPTLTDERKRAAYIMGANVYAQRGWTNLHSMSVDPNDIDLIESLSASGDIKIRVYNSADVSSAEQVNKFTPSIKDSEGLITNRAIKLYSDGALGSRGAALLEPYKDDPKNEGLLLIKKDTIMPILRTALKTGVQVNTHAIGDRANRLLLDWYEQAFAEVPAGERAIAAPRWRVEHAQILSLDDIARFEALGIIPSMQPSHAIGDLHFAFDRLGKRRLAGGYAWRSLIDSGAIIAGGSDAPVEVGSPLIEFYAATVRKDLSGFSNENWYPTEKVTPIEALKMFTIWPAFAAYEDTKLGSIEVRKQADFTVFDRDIMTAAPQDIMKAQTVLTIVNGQIAYQMGD
jgi:predicted amidohydrolase YtcJ